MMSAASAILEIPEVRARMSRLSVSEYHQLGEFNDKGRRTELIRGLVIEKMSKSPLHSAIASALYDLLRAQVPEGHWLRKEEPLTFADSEPEPDLSLVRGARSDYMLKHPGTAELVVEIAVISAALDREKAALYAEAGVSEYWIILASERRVEVYRQPENGSYQECITIDSGFSLQALALPSLSIPLADLFG